MKRRKNSFTIFSLTRPDYGRGEEVELPNGNIVKRWESCRTLLVVNFLEGLGVRIDRRLLPTSVIIDVIVNAADELSDFDYSKTSKEKVYYNNVRFNVGWTLLFSYIIRNYTKISDGVGHKGAFQETFDDVIREYAIALSMIPLIERETYETIRASEDERVKLEASITNYPYRAYDIDMFSSIFIETSDLSDGTKYALYRTLRYLRALDILSKDFYDLEYDMERQDAYTPLVAIHQKHGTLGVSDHVRLVKENIMNRAGDEIGDILKEYSGCCIIPVIWSPEVSLTE